MDYIEDYIRKAILGDRVKAQELIENNPTYIYALLTDAVDRIEELADYKWMYEELTK